ncbi:MAG: tryptophan tryptophylquinone biosynthesis enzyme MauG [Gammaproteobacteria bacterium]|nr:tryptophan tryptophylquinone biosynthesis enzyme MauG [Gammaproteobacteria bacterium]MDH5801388.1 tryptophan tryptophylquinone biosynthesis enzyme MauG [Gammaproteobacteria bacterium]
MKPIKLTLILGSVVGLAAAGYGGYTVFSEQMLSELQKQYAQPTLEIPAKNQTTPQRVQLGKTLFFDPRLSGSNWISCATCHNPAMGWSDGLPTAIGNNQQLLERATPTITNVAYNKLHMWDGRFRSLEKQALGPIEAPEEMNQNVDELVKELSSLADYVKMFEAAYPGEGISKDTIAKALANFQRTIVASNSPFDEWIKGKEGAISIAAKNGFKLFNGKANCNKCHMGHNFADNGFHNIGLKNSGDDQGRFSIRPVEISKGAFKTPTLRDITKTAPYMHNGIYATLEEVIDHYDRGGDIKSNLSPNIEPLNLSKIEKQELLEFLKSLVGDSEFVAVPELPTQLISGKESS